MRFLGGNHRLSEIHASLGLSQLKRIKKFINRRNYIANFYDKLFNDYSNKVTTSKSILLISIILNLIAYVIATFYIEKIVMVVPFYFSLDENYKPCLKNECKIGVMTSIVLFFISTQKSLINNINLFVK